MTKKRAATKPMRAGARIIDQTPQTLEEATKLVSTIARLTETIEVKRTVAEAEIQKILAEATRKKTETEEAVAPLIEQAEELAGLVRAYAASHRKELTDDEKRLTVKLPTGDSLRWRTFPPSVFLLEEKTFFDEVRSHGEEFEKLFIRTKEEPDREALSAHPAKSDLLQSVVIGNRQMFEIVPERTEHHWGIDLTAKKPKWNLVPPPKPKAEKKKKKKAS